MHTLKNRLLIATIGFVISSPLYAQNGPMDWPALTEQYQQTRLEKFSAKENLKAFQNYARAHSDNSLAALYVGSSHCLVARDAWMPWTKINSANACVDKMESAYQNVQTQYSPSSVDRLNADLTIGLTSANLPDSFKQQQVATETLTHAMQHPGFKQLPATLQTQVIDTLAKFQD